MYGGSVENRTRFGLEVLRALKDVWGPNRVAFKINPSAGVNDVVYACRDYTWLIIS
jgi:2,4-dienoyl-CoA reductase-like NADH-dependent reductase (Old Yellow Enzyme family)